jgi:hypothetical protein
MIESTNERQRRRCARERIDWNEIESLGELHGLIANDGYAASFQDMGQYRSALVRHMGNVLRKLAAGQSKVRAWRERMGKPADWPLHAPTDVERAMVAEIAELRAAARSQAAPTAQLVIGMANNDLGVHINIMQRHANGNTTVLYQAKVPAGDSFAHLPLPMFVAAPASPAQAAGEQP